MSDKVLRNVLILFTLFMSCKMRSERDVETVISRIKITSERQKIS